MKPLTAAKSSYLSVYNYKQGYGNKRQASLVGSSLSKRRKTVAESEEIGEETVSTDGGGDGESAGTVASTDLGGTGTVPRQQRAVNRSSRTGGTVQYQRSYYRRRVCSVHRATRCRQNHFSLLTFEEEHK